MNAFFDTSALMKRYIVSEKGNQAMDILMQKVEIVKVSDVTLIECISTLKRLLVDGDITENEYENIKKDIYHDFHFYDTIPFSSSIKTSAIEIIDKYQLKAFDSVQLASALFVKDEIDYVIVSDEKLQKATQSEGIEIIDPNKQEV